MVRRAWFLLPIGIALGCSAGGNNGGGVIEPDTDASTAPDVRSLDAVITDTNIRPPTIDVAPLDRPVRDVQPNPDAF